MAVSINNGALSVEFTADLDDFDKQIEKGIKAGIAEVKKIEDELMKSFKGGGKTLEKSFEKAIQLSEQIAPLIEKGLSGIDPGKLEELNEQVLTTTDEFEVLNKTIDFIKENLNDLNLNPQELELLNSGITQIQRSFAGLSGEQKSVISQLRSLKEQLNKQSQSGTLFGDTLKQASALEEKIKGVKTELKLAGSNAPGLVATGQAVKGLVAGFTALQGTMALLGGENEDLEKTTQSLIASMSVLEGISSVLEVLDKNSALNVFLTAQARKQAATATAEQVIATEALAVAEQSQTAATTAAETATEGLNTAMKANPAGILLLGLTALVAGIQFFTRSTKDAIQEQTNLNRALLEIESTAESLRQKLIAATPDALDLEVLVKRAQALRAAGASQADLLKTEEQIANKRKEIAEKTFLIWNNETNRFENRIDLFKKANEESLKELISQKSKIESLQLNIAKTSDGKEKERLQKEKDYLQSVYDLNVDNYDRLNEQINEYYNSVSDSANASLEKEKFFAEQSLKSATAFAEAKVLLVKKSTQAELDATIAAIKARAKEELANPDLTAGERARILAQQQKEIKEAQDQFAKIQLEDQRAFLQAQLEGVKEGSAEELRLRIELLKKSSEIELREAGITEGKIFEIKAKTAAQIAELTKKFNQQVLEDEINTNISIARAKLAAAKEGSQEELNFKLDLLDEQAQLQIAQAKDQIENEKLLQAKIDEILSESLAGRKQLIDQFTEEVIRKQFEALDRQVELLNDPLQRVLTNPKSSGNDKYKAQLEININLIETMRQKQRLLAEAIVAGKGDVLKMVQAYENLSIAIKKLNDEIEKNKTKKLADDLKNLGSDILKVSTSLGDMANALKGTNDSLSDTFDTLSSIGEVAGNVVNSVGQFISGDPVAGIQSAVKAIAGIFSIGKAARESRRKAQREIDEFYARIIAGEIELTQIYRDRARDLVLLNKIRIDGLKDERKLLLEQNKAVQDQYNIILKQLQAESFVADTVTKKYGGVFGIGRKTKAVEVFQSLAGKSFEELEKLFSEGRLTGKAKELFEQLQKIKQEGVDIDTLLAENAQNFREAITGTTSDSIVDNIIEGFKQGMDSAKDFADNFQDLMQNAVLQSLKLKYLEGPLKNFFEQFAELSDSGNSLTQGEIDRLREMYNTILEKAADQFDQLQQVAGLNFNTNSDNRNTLTGAIKGITEQQAELLAGQFSGLRLTAIEQLREARRGIEQLQIIEFNTRTLHDVKAILRRLELNGIKVL